MAISGLASILIIAMICVLPAVAQPGLPPTPYVIKYGYVSYENESPCNGPIVNVSNLNTSKEWQAETYASSNHYELVLANGTDVNASENLRFIAYDNTSSYEHFINVTDHVVTEDDVNAGGVFDFNLTLNHYCMNYYPDYPYHIQADWNYSGAAVMKMWADFKGVTGYNQEQLQTMGHANNSNSNKDILHVDPQGIAYTLRGIIDLPPGHTFTVGVMPGDEQGLNWALHRICWWQYTGPGVLPTDGYYAKWMSVRGIHTDRNPHDGHYGGYGGDWGYNVSGFWINDPHNESLQGPGGIGANSYKTAAEWTTTYYKVIIDLNNSYYNNSYITVLEPPECDADVRIVPAKPRLDHAITPVMMQKTLVIDGIEKDVLVETAEDEDALDVVGAAIDGVTEELVPYDAAFADVFAKTVAGEPMLVSSDNGDYYIVPFGVPVKVRPIPLKKPVEIQKFDIDVDGVTAKLLRAVEGKAVIEQIPIELIRIKEERTLVVVRVDAEDGSFKEASWVASPVKYLPVSKAEALRLVFDEIGITKSKPVIELVNRDLSPYYPDWKITIGGMVFYVSQDRTVSYDELAPAPTPTPTPTLPPKPILPGRIPI